MYEDIVIRRKSSWTSVEGNRFETTRYIKVIFYIRDDVKNNRPYYSYGAFGAVVGGGTTNKQTAIDFVNRHKNRDEPEVTADELDKAIEKFRQRILAKEEPPVVYFHSYDDEVVRCPHCAHEYNVKPHDNYVLQCERCKKLYRVASI
jgi:hypothetical protein